MKVEEPDLAGTYSYGDYLNWTWGEMVVQPDLCVVCDPIKIDKRGLPGRPGLDH